MKKLNTRRGGFTLIELMIVVAIIGILAAIAIPNFLRFQLKAKSSEGKTNLSAIRTAEESYYAEYGVYVPALASPTAVAQNLKTTYVDAVANEGFAIVGWSPEGDVFFNYAVETATNDDGFMASASADIDANGTGQIWGYHKPDGAGANVPGLSHGTNLGTCTFGTDPVTTLITNAEVGRCTAASGNSEF